MDEAMMPREQPGWYGMFTRYQMPDAMANGARVVKVATEEGDAHPLGATATVLGSIGHPKVGLAYFVEWDAFPGVAVLVVAWKIAARHD